MGSNLSADSLAERDPSAIHSPAAATAKRILRDGSAAGQGLTDPGDDDRRVTRCVAADPLRVNPF